ncbi:MAG: prepilin peptidase [Clostridia bacterium]|nr:prepilin peptidase [Clostridia bacterium]
MDFYTLFAQAAFLFPLTWCAVSDICDGRIHDESHILVMLGGLPLFMTLTGKQMAVSLICGGIFILTALLTGRIRRRALGGADVKLMTLTVICAGIRASLTVFMTAFVCAGAVSAAVKLFAILSKRAFKTKSRPVLARYGGGIPFAPFLLAGVCIYYCFQA